MKMRASFLVIVSSLSLVGCHRGTELHVISVPAAQLDQGWDVAQSRDQLVSIGVPPGWHSGVDTLGSSLADMASKFGNSSSDNQPPADPAMSAEMQSLAQKSDEANKKQEEQAIAALEKKGIVINVINGSKPIPGEERTRFYVKHSHEDGAIFKDEAIETERKHYAFPPKPTEFKLPIGTAWRFTADDSLRDGMTLHQISYVVIDGGDTYTLRFITEEAPESIQSIDDFVAKSLRIKAGPQKP